MTYGFVDKSTHFLYSVEMTLDLPGLGTIRLGNIHKTRAVNDLPPSVIDLQFYVPQLLARRGNDIEVGSLPVPGPQAPTALRRTLNFLIAEMSPSHPNRRDLVMQAEEQIVATNRVYYRNLLAFLRTLSPNDPVQISILEDFVRVCDLQLAHIQNYTAFAKS